VNVFIDTNIIIDLLAKRESFYREALQLFSLADSNKIHVTISALSLVNTHYILNDVMKLKDARSILGKFKVIVQSYALNDKVIELALSDPDFKDFEDGIQYYTALESIASLIITRNLKDFRHSAIPVMSPKEFLAKRKFER